MRNGVGPPRREMTLLNLIRLGLGHVLREPRVADQRLSFLFHFSLVSLHTRTHRVTKEEERVDNGIIRRRFGFALILNEKYGLSKQDWVGLNVKRSFFFSDHHPYDVVSMWFEYTRCLGFNGHHLPPAYP